MPGTPLKFLLIIIFPLFSIATSASNSSDILYENEYLVRVYKDGRVERLSGTEIVPPSLDPRTGVLSKDITIDPNLPISARVFLPQNAAVSDKLPLLVYFHGGGFFTDSAFSPTYHNHLNSLAAEANVVAVSVNYRLAPEHYLPTAYEDSWLALKWVFSHCRAEAWLGSHVDFGRVWLGGDSAGANIAHNMAIRVGLAGMDGGIVVQGMFLNCPYFWGSEALAEEVGDPRAVWVESIWIHVYPNSTGLDDPLLNPGMDPNLGRVGCGRVLVYVAGLDVLRGRGWYYAEALKKSEWGGSTVEVVEVKGVQHIFSINSPNTTEAIEMLENLAFFLNSDVVSHKKILFSSGVSSVVRTV